MTHKWILELLVVPLVAAVIVPSLAAGLGRQRTALFPLTHALLLAVAVAALQAAMNAGQIVTESAFMEARFELVLDERRGVALVFGGFLLLVLSIFSRGFVRGARHSTAFLALLLLAQGALNAVLLAGDLFVLYSGLLVLSFALMMLIGLDFAAVGERAALRVLATLEIPSALALASFWFISSRAGTARIDALAQQLVLPSNPLSWIVVAPIIIAVISRLGLVPLQNWPIAGCRAATAPVAIVVVAIALPAGAFVLSRLYGVVIPSQAPWNTFLIGLSVLTAILAGIGAIRERHSLAWLAYLGVGQMGLATLGLVAPTSTSHAAGWIGLLGSALALALVGMGLGLAMRATRQIWIDSLIDAEGHWLTRIPLLFGMMVLAPVPPLPTFVARRVLVADLLSSHSTWGDLAAGGVVVATLLLALAVWRPLVESSPLREESALARTGGDSTGAETEAHHLPVGATARGVRQVPWSWEIPSALLALTLVIGCLGLTDPFWLPTLVASSLPLWPNIAATLLIGVVVGLAFGEPTLVSMLGSRRRSARVLRQVGSLWKHWRLDSALDPYVLIGGLLMILGQASAVILDQTLGRLARAR